MGEKTIYYIIGIGVIGIGIGRYENYYIGILSVSADIEKSLSVVHWLMSWLGSQKKLTIVLFRSIFAQQLLCEKEMKNGSIYLPYYVGASKHLSCNCNLMKLRDDHLKRKKRNCKGPKDNWIEYMKIAMAKLWEIR